MLPKVQQCDLAIELHLIQNQDCTNNYNNQQFAEQEVHSISQH